MKVLLPIRIQQLRKENMWTQYELAERLELSRSAIASWETGRREPDLKTILKLANLFHVTLDYLVGLEKEQKTG
ncbi:MAG TPA: helix-turn-helix transcriptional regulator [Clostridia bacterium]|nr:helix-turn-helix transcriptional regulator [Clostridia bacterium]